jgi:hypothetical protein
MTRNLLAIAALSAALGYSVPATNAAPASGMIETLKASAVEAGTIQQIRHYRRHYRHHRNSNCWWQDRWLCRYLW